MTAEAQQAGTPCPGPNPTVNPPRRLNLPVGAVDTHCHVIGAADDYPYTEPRFYTPPSATPEAYIDMLDGTGLTFGVLIQVSLHGTDNRLMLNVLRQNPGRLRGIGVAPLGLGESHYLRLKEAGVVGLRLNNLYSGGIGFERLEEYDSLAQELGWHLQFFTNLESLYEMRSRIAKLKSIVVIDHMGAPHLSGNSSTASVDTKYFQNLVSLVSDGAWVKLSGGFRISQTGFPYGDTIPFARALLETGSTRCLWGSDWPHVAHWGFMMTVGDLLDLFADWAPEVELQRRVLVDNPRSLYGFSLG